MWGKLKAGWAGQLRASLDSCSLQLHCTYVVDSKYSVNGAVRREGWEERTERDALRWMSGATGESSLSLIINRQCVISSVLVVLVLFFINDNKNKLRYCLTETSE